MRCSEGDHPRLCGEKSFHSAHELSPMGSPPPMRGKVLGDLDGENSMRITPAYAGKSLFYSAVLFVCWDHPRLCGEKCTICGLHIAHNGSPPPMRGKGSLGRLLLSRVGITPAYAGKRPCRPHRRGISLDHPRLCGEKFFGMDVQERDAGSPPPMRGKGIFFRSISAFSRITPAYAGKRVH